MSHTQHRKHKDRKTEHKRAKDRARIVYIIDENGKRVRFDKKTGKPVRMRRGLYYILRRTWRTYRAQRRAARHDADASQSQATPRRLSARAVVEMLRERVVVPVAMRVAKSRASLRALVQRAAVLVRSVGAQVCTAWRQRATALSAARGDVVRHVRGVGARMRRVLVGMWSSMGSGVRGVGVFLVSRGTVWRTRCVQCVRAPYVALRAWRDAARARKKTRKGAAPHSDAAPETKHASDGAITYTSSETARTSVVARFLHVLWRVVRSFLLSMVDVFVLVVIALSVIIIYVWQTTPDASTMLAPEKIAETTVIYDRTGTTELYKIHGEEDRKRIAHDDIPDFMRFATIAAEDDAFYSHFGIDPFSIARAVKENLLRGTLAQGGSTITQQLARNVFFTREKTLERKVREAVMALKIEQMYTKDEILDAYLNVVPYGANAYGVEAAAEVYFGKHARELTLDEAALLASLPKATTTFSPYGTHTNRLIARQKMILERMRELGFVSDDAIDAALETDTLAKVKPLRQSIVSPHFVFHAIEELERTYDRDFLKRGGLKVYTTIDLKLQALGEEVVAQGVARNARYRAQNAALVAVDPRTGDILAMVGSKDYYATDIDGQVNVTTRLRQPGSAFKPFAYATAFAKGYQPETVVWDVLTNFGPDGSGKNYMPHNYTGRFHGLVSLRNALAQSLNVPAVKVLYLAGIDTTIDTAQRMGITSLTDRSRYGLALVLGGAEVRPLDITAAFGVFANDGVRVPAHAIAKIVDRDGTVIYDAQTIHKARVLDAQVARKINSILSDNAARTPAFGRNNPLVVPGHTVAAKTGTTQNYRDAWTVGYTPEIAVGVWAGNNDNRPMRAGAAGAVVAAPIWHDFMTRVLAQRPDVPFPDYVRVTTSVPMVGGSAVPQRYIVGQNRVVGAHYKPKKSKKKKEKVRTVYHSILYYIDKDHPLTSTTPNWRDPMLPRWEAALHRTAPQKKKK